MLGLRLPQHVGRHAILPAVVPFPSSGPVFSNLVARRLLRLPKRVTIFGTTPFDLSGTSQPQR